MPYVANEAVHAAYWAQFPVPEKAAWLDQYATLRGGFGPPVTPDEAYQQAEQAYLSEGYCHPRLALAVNLMLGPARSSNAESPT